ncbi:aldo/keto reductase [Schleiferilactobacillus harbinensis]|uniref:Aldo/keto reductase n=2 Tax=Schleiferilactobacillus harbinensis TaxID=304207 RepID=A0A510TW42_9LACO|nr:aldo/keto reductase [Schleiferilactobacillus harbinensis]KRM25884.1 aldo keto reductase family protein [Schleiferilactobacillus harbinensis DSM 16991]MCI1687213.1 aldo/keto reductase [Schleiferilactobacillus harbinensis]MCI1783023.1 aldo/keto reductase [Schleiferilactobacillus harbinensis]MCI1851191.1 aldo/keto reductase [Schleiferilactobacillus harbinensis]MCT2907339.1 aldo/keto reductase [Schleiferilactobacillus harbinensis]
MQYVNIGHSGLRASAIGLGLMRVSKKSDADAAQLVATAIDHGINFFDNADVYSQGKAEEKFGAALKIAAVPREKLVIQTKVGITDKRYDFSKDHIIEAVNGSLERMGLDYVDSLLLHRPDPLMEPDEIAEAFLQLLNQGKVRQFGVSNFNPMQVALVQQAVPMKLIANQLQLSIMHTGMIDYGMHTNMTDPRSVDHDGGILEYSRLHDMTIQAWSPYQYGFFEGVFIDNPKFPKLNDKLHELAAKYGSNVNALAAAWILRIPANMQVIAGTMNPERLAEIADIDRIKLTKQEWYDIYFAAGNDLP